MSTITFEIEFQDENTPLVHADMAIAELTKGKIVAVEFGAALTRDEDK